MASCSFTSISLVDHDVDHWWSWSRPLRRCRSQFEMGVAEMFLRVFWGWDRCKQLFTGTSGGYRREMSPNPKLNQLMHKRNTQVFFDGLIKWFICQLRLDLVVYLINTVGVTPPHSSPALCLRLRPWWWFQNFLEIDWRIQISEWAATFTCQFFCYTHFDSLHVRQSPSLHPQQNYVNKNICLQMCTNVNNAIANMATPWYTSDMCLSISDFLDKYK